MNYDLQAIGNRIKKERKAAGLKKQGDLTKKMGLSEYSRQTVGNWENGTVLPCLDDLLKMCEIFDCELGYLLCEYDCKTKELTNIHEVTGLSENAIKMLSDIKKTSIEEVIITLNRLLERKDFIDLLCSIHSHIWSFNNHHLMIDDEKAEIVASVFDCNKYNVKNYVEASSESLIASSILKIIRDLK